jgi:hypothetical protein
MEGQGRLKPALEYHERIPGVWQIYIHPYGLCNVGKTLAQAIGRTIQDNPALVSFALDPKESDEALGQRILADPEAHRLTITPAHT